MPNELTALYLTPEDITVFQKFQRHYALIGLLDSIGAFDIRSGSVTIHFDANGHIGSVDKYLHFKAKKEV
jgi:hypothetical protein